MEAKEERIAVEGRILTVIRHSRNNWELQLPGDNWITARGYAAVRAWARHLNEIDDELYHEWQQEQRDKWSASHHF